MNAKFFGISLVFHRAGCEFVYLITITEISTIELANS